MDGTIMLFMDGFGSENHRKGQTMTETILANAQLVLPEEVVHGNLRIADGRIAEIGLGTAAPAGAIDCAGDMVMPGLIELHTDNRYPGAVFVKRCLQLVTNLVFHLRAPLRPDILGS